MSCIESAGHCGNIRPGRAATVREYGSEQSQTFCGFPQKVQSGTADAGRYAQQDGYRIFLIFYDLLSVYRPVQAVIFEKFFKRRRYLFVDFPILCHYNSAVSVSAIRHRGDAYLTIDRHWQSESYTKSATCWSTIICQNQTSCWLRIFINYN